MKKKGNFRKVVSGLLAGMTMLSTVLSPMTAYWKTFTFKKRNKN